MKIMRVLLCLFIALPAFATTKEITPLQSSQECKVNAIPSYYPFVPRPIQNTFVKGIQAQKKLEQIKSNSQAQFYAAQDQFLQPVGVVQLEIASDSQNTGSCVYNAKLEDVCVVESLGTKCSQVCTYSYSCEDNR